MVQPAFGGLGTKIRFFSGDTSFFHVSGVGQPGFYTSQ
jgi:hypothetical protein